ncbi:hypothetical protein ACFPZL_00385 [Leucobacter soli]|uniref:DUF4230 domain-containing protein n=1 Tax=Leucobacter soli TaxID=2812850 RepID=A0A916NHM6_9MICO|nr:hypothetical protein [Leucobacter soli]CAG7615246.1 hypothetical protein LEUCIP111803_01859 [Leucobacter soli]
MLVKFVIKLVLGLVLIVGLLGGGVALAVGPLSGILGDAAPASATESMEKIVAVLPQDQVVLVSLVIEGVEKEDQETKKIWGIAVPGSERAKLLGYAFNAKLGIEGKDVEIEKLDEKQYRVTVPSFIFIGHDEVKFESAVEKNGILSWVAPEIDQSKMTNAILDGERQLAYVDKNREMLQDQARSHYDTIISAIDPSIELEYVFTD